MRNGCKWCIIFLFLLMSCFLSGREAAASDGLTIARVDIRVEPSSLLLGESEDAVVYAKLVTNSGKTVPNANIVLTVNVGSITATARGADGIVTAVYVPPREYYPQWAIITAIATLPGFVVHGVHCLPLYGVGKAAVESKPNANVNLKIGENEFGPVKANRKGQADFDIVAPPGTRFGKAGGRSVDLNLPQMNRLSSIAESNVAIAGDEMGVPIWIHAINEKGGPLEEGKIDIAAVDGKVRGLKRIRNGLYRVEYFAPSKVGDGKDFVTIALSNHPISQNTLSMTIVSGVVTELEIDVNPDGYVADRNEPIIVEVRAFDGVGNPAYSQIEFLTNFGTIGKGWWVGPGRYAARLLLPKVLGELSVARVSAKARSGDNEIKVHYDIPMRAGKAKEIRLDPKTVTFVRRAGHANTVRMTITDVHGNRISDETIELSVNDGAVPRTVSSYETGEYSFLYTPNLESDVAMVTITARVQGIVGKAVLRSAEDPLLSLCPHVGFISNFEYLYSPFFSAQLEANLDVLLKGLFIGVEVAFFFSKETESEFGFESTFYMFPIAASIGYRYRLGHWLRIFGRVGGGPHIVAYTKKQNATEDLSQRETTFNVGAALGVDMRLGIGDVVAQIGYIHAKIRNIEETGGIAGGMLFSIGYRFGLWPL